MKRGKVLIILLFLALGALAGCGDDDDESSPTTRPNSEESDTEGDDSGSDEAAAPDEWVRSLCGEIVNWQGELEGLGQSLQTGLENVSDLETARTALVEFVGDAVTATDEMLAGIDQLGSPDVDDGDQIAAEIRSGLQDLRQVFVDGQERAQELPVDDPAAFTSESEQLGTDISEAGDQIAANFDALDDELQSDELDQAFEDEPACAPLN